MSYTREKSWLVKTSIEDVKCYSLDATEALMPEEAAGPVIEDVHHDEGKVNEWLKVSMMKLPVYSLPIACNHRNLSSFSFAVGEQEIEWFALFDCEMMQVTLLTCVRITVSNEVT